MPEPTVDALVRSKDLPIIASMVVLLPTPPEPRTISRACGHDTPPPADSMALPITCIASSNERDGGAGDAGGTADPCGGSAGTLVEDATGTGDADAFGLVFVAAVAATGVATGVDDGGEGGCLGFASTSVTSCGLLALPDRGARGQRQMSSRLCDR